MAISNHLKRIIYTDGSNGIVRLPPLIWRAFYEAALYLEIDSVQECMMLYLEAGGWIYRRTDFVQVVEKLENHPAYLERNEK